MTFSKSPFNSNLVLYSRTDGEKSIKILFCINDTAKCSCKLTDSSPTLREFYCGNLKIRLTRKLHPKINSFQFTTQSLLCNATNCFPPPPSPYIYIHIHTHRGIVNIGSTLFCVLLLESEPISRERLCAFPQLCWHHCRCWCINKEVTKTKARRAALFQFH